MVEVDRSVIPSCGCRHIEIEVYGKQWGFSGYDFQERRIGQAQAGEFSVAYSFHTGDDGFRTLFDESPKRNKELRALGLTVLSE